MSLLLLLSRSASASAFTPASIANLAWWLDASDTATITNTAGAVDQWNDKSSEANHVTSTGGLRPTTALRTVNSKNALDFTNDNMTCPSGIYTLGSSANTIFVVFASDNTGDATQSLIHGLNGASGLRYSVQFDTTNLLVQNRSTSSSTTSQAMTRNTSTRIVAFVRSGTSITPYVNGVAGTAGTNAEDITAASMFIGANAAGSANRFDGVLCEVVAYRAALNSTQIGQVGSYLATKWAGIWGVVAALMFNAASNSQYFGTGVV